MPDEQFAESPEQIPKYFRRRYVSDKPPADADVLTFNATSKKWVPTAPGAGHASVTLAADADTLLGISGQELSLDSQAANTGLFGPTSGAAADPTFRAIVNADLPTTVTGFVSHAKWEDF